MNKNTKFKEAAEKWARFLDSLPEDTLPRDPVEFITGVLGYGCTPFHRRWWNFTCKNQYSLLLAPRGHGKSTILTIAFSIYRVLQNPDLRVLIVSSTAAQACAFLREIKNHLELNTIIMEKCGALAGRPWTDNEINLTSRLNTAKEATMTAMGVLGPIVSRHYDIIILDDVVDEEAARSKAMRERQRVWYFKELLPTLEPNGELHVIGTRYHHDDLYGKLIQTGMPSLIERAIIETNGVEKALWEEMFPLELLRKKREQAGPAIFNSQYQNDTAAMKGSIFRPEWIETRTAPPCLRKFQGVDLAIGQEDHHDYFAHLTIGESEYNSLHVLGIHRKRLPFEEQFRTIRTLFAAYDRTDSPVVAVGVEANAYQEALVQRLRRETSLPVVAVKQTRDKIARAMRLQGAIQTGRIVFPPSGAGELIEELLAFPDSDHDDLVDALEIAVRMASEARRYSELPLGTPDLYP